MSKVYQQFNSITGVAGVAFGGGGGGSRRRRRRKTLGPGGGSDPGNSDRAGVLANRRDPSAAITVASIAVGAAPVSYPIRVAAGLTAWFSSSN